MTRTLLALCGLCLPIFAADFITSIGDGYETRTSAMATDAGGNTYLTGTRRIPTAGGNANDYTTDIFVTKVDALGKIVFTTTFSGKSNDTASGIALDSVGNIFVVGSTTSLNFPLQGALQATPGQSTTGFLMKLNAVGSILFSTYFGGTQASSQLAAVAVDQSGDVYVTGSTNSQDYPRTPGLPAGTVVAFGPGPTTGALFAKISGAGDRVIYAGVISGTQRACSGGGSSCFLSFVNTGGVALGVDAAGNAYVAGNSTALDLPTTTGVLVPKGFGAFVFKVNADGKGLGYLTYLSSTIYGRATFGQSSTTVQTLTVDPSGSVYLTGLTADPNFPVTAGAFQTAYTMPVNDQTLFGAPPASDAFVAKLKADGTGMNWATYLGVAEIGEVGTSLAVDSTGAVYLAGLSGTRDFVAKLDSLGTSAQIRIQPANTTASGIAFGPPGRFQQAGGTGILASVENIFSGPRFFGPSNAANGVLTGRLAPGEIISIYGEALSPASALTATPTAGAFPTLLGETQVTIGGISAPLLYVSPTQINTVVPNGSVVGTAAPIRVLVRGELRAEFRSVIVGADPQIFRSSTGSAAAINEDGSINSASNPAKWGSFVAVWATGVGPFLGFDGGVATDAQGYCSLCRIFRNDISPNTDLVAAYRGSSPGLVNGAVQMNFRLPAGSGTNPPRIIIRVGSAFSEAVPIYVKP